MQHFNACFDFARCDNETLASLFPSKFGGRNRIPVSYRHTAAAIRQFQELGNRQQTNLITQDDASPAPLLPELKNYPCLGLSVQYLVKNVVNETRKATIFDGYCHLIREAIRSKADNIRDQLYPEYCMTVQGIIVSNNNVRLILNEMNTQLHTSVVRDNFYFSSAICTKNVSDNVVICNACEQEVCYLQRKCVELADRHGSTIFSNEFFFL